MRRVVSLLTGCAIALGRARAAHGEADTLPEPPTVILLHGLGRTDRSMRPLASRLTDAGFRVHNLRYPSTNHTPDELLALIHTNIGVCCTNARRVHFVTHSLGGVLVRAYLADHRLANLGRVVMLAPPNQGSEIVDALGESAAFQWTFGPTGAQLGTGEDSLPNRLPPPYYEVGVIAGTRSVNPVGSAMIPDANDGAVAVERTRLRGMSDFMTLPVSHTFIMRAPETARQTIHFLRHGRFQPAAAAQD